MADSKLSALSLKGALVGNPFNDRLYRYLASGATDADKQVASLLADLLLMDARVSSAFWSDFHNSNPAEMFTYVGGTGSGNGADNTGADQHPGVQRAEPGTSTTGYGGFCSGSAYSFTKAQGQSRFLAIVKTPSALSDGTTTYSLMFGLSDQLATYEPNAGIYIHYRHNVNSGYFRFTAKNGGSQTDSDTGVLVAADTWYVLQLDINAAGTQATATIYPFGSATPSGSTPINISTNLPSNEMYFIAWQVLKSAGATNRPIYLDGAGWLQALANPR